MSTLMVCNTSVRRHGELFCLNDLHGSATEAGENERTKEPSKFLASSQTKALVSEIESSTQNLGTAVKVINGGRNRGTYVCKELVYAYAMWVSAAFHLKVIRAFDALVAGDIDRAKAEVFRSGARLEYRPMTDALRDARAEQGKETASYHYSNEADLINRIVLGMTAAKFKVEHDLDKTANLRDYLTPAQIKAVQALQRANTVYIEDGLSFDERKARLQSMFERRHHAALIEEIHLLSA